METIFETVLTMSMKASVVLLIVLAARLLLKNAPRKYSYVLWAVVLFRLVCPFSPELSFGALDFSEVNQGIETARDAINIAATEGVGLSGGAANGNTNAADGNTNASPGASVPNQAGNEDTGAKAKITVTFVLSLAWLAGAVTLLSVGMVSYARLKRKLRTATLVSGNVFESGRIGTAFVTGVFRPKVYLPLGLAGKEREYVLEHEHMHIRHGDNIVKFAAYLVLCLHWFNPLVWVAFTLMAKDMEMKCDEAVVAKLGSGIMRDYGQSILSLAVNRRFPVANPLAFGESNTKQRVKNIMNYKKPAFWVIAGALVICLVVGIFGIIERKPVQENDPPNVGNEEDSTVQNDLSEPQTGQSISLPAKFTGSDVVRVLEDGSASVSKEEMKQMLMFFESIRYNEINWNALTLDNVLEFFWNMTYIYGDTASGYDSESGYAGNIELCRQIADDMRQYYEDGRGSGFTAAYTLEEFNAHIKTIYGEHAGSLTKEKLIALEKENVNGDFVKYVESVDGIAIFFGARGGELRTYYPYQITKVENGYIVDAFDNANLNNIPDNINDFKNTSTDMLLSMRKNMLIDTIDEEMTGNADYENTLASAKTLDELVTAVTTLDLIDHMRFAFGQNADGSLYIISKERVTVRQHP